MASHPFTIATLPKHEEWMRTYRARGGTFSDAVRTAIALAHQKRLEVVETPNPSDGTDSSVRLDSGAVEQLDAIRGLAPRLTFLRAVAAAYMDAYQPEPIGFEPPIDDPASETPGPASAEVDDAEPTSQEE